MEASQSDLSVFSRDFYLRVIDWLTLRHGTGISSRSIVEVVVLGKTPKDPGACHPFDSSDFKRCLDLLNYSPELRDHLDQMRNISTAWQRLIDNWDVLESLFLEEVGSDLDAFRSPSLYEQTPKTRKMIADLTR